MSLLPSFSVEYQNQAAGMTTVRDLQGLEEWDVDFSTGQLTGETVTGTRAVEVWIWKCLMTERFHYPIYSWQYGSELETYMGQALTQEYIDTDVRMALRDALLINPEIRSVTNFSGELVKDKLKMSFTVNTEYGDVTVSDYIVGQ